MNESSRAGALVPPDLYDMGALLGVPDDEMRARYLTAALAGKEDIPVVELTVAEVQAGTWRASQAIVALGPDATIAQMAAWLRARDAEEAAR